MVSEGKKGFASASGKKRPVNQTSLLYIKLYRTVITSTVIEN